jgi:alpha-tubulin suppressor-like RCC1 family protein
MAVSALILGPLLLLALPADPVWAVLSPTPISATAVAAGRGHTCAILAGGTVACWGDGQNGDLGNGPATDSNGSDMSMPVTVYELTGATQIAAGHFYTCALISDGTVDCWGEGPHGELGNGRSGTYSAYPQQVDGLRDASALTAGGSHACAIVSGGMVECWGANHAGQLGNGSTSDSSVPARVSGISGATAISAGEDHTCAIVAGGKVECWGGNYEGQLGNGSTASSSSPVIVPGLSGATDISAGSYASCAIVSGGTVKCWGINSGGPDNAMVRYSAVPVAVSGISGATSTVLEDAYGYMTTYACALVDGGAVTCWGDTWSSGNSATASGPDRVTVSGLSDAVSLTAGDAYTCVVLAHGMVKCWGFNDVGQLGNGTKDNSQTPTTVTVGGVSKSTVLLVGAGVLGVLFILVWTRLWRRFA